MSQLTKYTIILNMAILGLFQGNIYIQMNDQGSNSNKQLTAICYHYP